MHDPLSEVRSAATNSLPVAPQSGSMVSSPEVVILIPSRNRPDDLQRTVACTLPLTGPSVQLVIADDASTDHRQVRYIEELRTYGDNVTAMFLTRHRGCTGTRLEALRQIRAKYAIILDDDANLMDPPRDLVKTIVDRFELEPRLAVQAFSVTVPNRASKTETVEEGMQDGCLTSSFINCGCALRLSAFWEVGGYRPEFDSPYIEEKDLSLRLLEAGWILRSFQSPRVMHHQTPVGRDDRRNLRGFTLNLLRLQWWYHPAWLAALNSVRGLGTTFVESVRSGRSLSAVMLGIADFVRDVPSVLRSRQTLSSCTLKAYYSLRRNQPMHVEDLEALATRSWVKVLTEGFTEVE